jgi:Fe-S oxidoreductase
MSGLGYQLIWWLMEQDEEVIVHRAFTDICEEGVAESDLLGFTLSWELDFTNVLSMLKANRIPLEGRERGEEHAIVFAGGPVLSANPEPFAEIFDVILLGDAEETVPRLLKCWKEIRSLSRSEKLLRLAQEAGIYVPSLYESQYEEESATFIATVPKQDGVPEIVSKSLFRAPDGYVAHSVLLSPDTTWGDVFLVEVVRSCPQECRFCLASFLTRPFRAANVDTIIEKIDLARPYTKRVGLLGPSITEHPEFESIADRLLERPDLKVTVASVRADTLTQQLVEKFCALGQKSVTIALESGSERLRRIMKKNLTEPEIFQAIEAIDRGGLDGVKFYGIAGLPYETQADLEETVRLLRQLKNSIVALSSFLD